VLLNELPVGSVAVVRAVHDGPTHEGRRLREIGLLPGTRIRVERRAPLGDPTVYEVRSTRMALRKEGAALVVVDEIVEPAQQREPGRLR
jgi:Fe2+ transport system protein FeoA